MGFELFLFLALGFVAVAAAAAMIISNNAIYSALFLIVNFGCVALLFLMLDAPFLAMVQIAVYAGAIMVLFLFVIMLLGAEEASDTSRPFRWLTGAATVLAASFLFAVAIPFVLSGGVELPDAPGEDPLLRVVHSANTSEPVTVTISGDTLDDAILLEGLQFGDVTDFLSVPDGDYIVSMTANDTTVLENEITLQDDDVFTAVAYGDEALALALVPNSFADSGENQGRLVVANLYDEAPVYLVEEGRNQRLDLEDSSTTISDTVIADELAFGEVLTASYREGEATFGFYQFVNGEYVEIAPVNDYDVNTGTEHVMLLVADYAAPANMEGEYRPRVLYRNEGRLDLATAENFGSPGDIGQRLFTRYLLPVNLVGFLLLVALVGVIVLTRPQGITTERRSTRNRRRKVARPLVGVISQQTGRDVIVDTPRLEDSAGD